MGGAEARVGARGQGPAQGAEVGGAEARAGHDDQLGEWRRGAQPASRPAPQLWRGGSTKPTTRPARDGGGALVGEEQDGGGSEANPRGVEVQEGTDGGRDPDRSSDIDQLSRAVPTAPTLLEGLDGAAASRAVKVDLPPAVDGGESAGRVTQAVDGFVNLGVPIGTDAYVAAELKQYLAGHDRRLRAIVEYSRCETAAASDGGAKKQRGIRLSVQLALHFLRFSANSRDVHLLRSKGRRVVQAAAEQHDRGVRAALAAILCQLELPKAGTCADVSDSQMTPEFVRAYPQMVLPTYQGGLGVRRWSAHADAAYVGQAALSWQSSMVPDAEGIEDTLFPALRTIIQAAGFLRVVPVGTPRPAGALRGAYDLAQAWAACVAATRLAYPRAAGQRQSMPGHATAWLFETHGAVENLILMPARAQKRLSRAVVRLELTDFVASLDRDGSLAGLEFKQNYMREAEAHTGDQFTAFPWMPDGQLHMGRSDVLINLCLRFMLVPQQDVVPRVKLKALTTCARCKHQIPTAEAVPSLLQRLQHQLVCPKNANCWKVTHNALEQVVLVFVEECGMMDVGLEPRWWDPDGTKEDGHCRPDIVCRHPETGVWWVIDVTVAWKAIWRSAVGTASAAAALATDKRAKYDEALRRVRARPGQRTVKFWPLALECNGAWGADMEELFDECVRMRPRRRGAELYHWSAMEFGKHWRQRIGVAVGRGRAMCASAAARTGSSTSSAGAAESSPYLV